MKSAKPRKSPEGAQVPPGQEVGSTGLQSAPKWEPVNVNHGPFRVGQSLSFIVKTDGRYGIEGKRGPLMSEHPRARHNRLEEEAVGKRVDAEYEQRVLAPERAAAANREWGSETSLLVRKALGRINSDTPPESRVAEVMRALDKMGQSRSRSTVERHLKKIDQAAVKQGKASPCD